MYLSIRCRNSSGSKETSTLVTGENKDETDKSKSHTTEVALAKDKFSDLAAVLLLPKHLGTVIVNSEADDYNPSLAEELNLKAK